MLAAALVAVAAAVPVGDGVHRGGGVALTVRGGLVVRTRARVRRYVCDPFGPIGPLTVIVRPGAEIAADGRVRFVAGPPSERLAVRARFASDGTATGRLRLRGTIGTGDPCRSPRVRFVLG